jgi:glycerol-3-phosphate cytidylyltransferase
VGVSTDEVVQSYKHKTPIIPFQDRCAIVEAIKYVDKVVAQEDMNKLAAIKRVNADVVFVGSDWKGSIAWTEYEKEFSSVGCKVVYLEHTEGISSTILRSKIL